LRKLIEIAVIVALDLIVKHRISGLPVLDSEDRVVSLSTTCHVSTMLRPFFCHVVSRELGIWLQMSAQELVRHLKLSLQRSAHIFRIVSLLAGRNCVRLRPAVPRCSLRENAGEHSLQHFVPHLLPSIFILVPCPVMLSWHQRELHAGIDLWTCSC